MDFVHQVLMTLPWVQELYDAKYEVIMNDEL
jgi:hypothetical protein